MIAHLNNSLHEVTLSRYTWCYSYYLTCFWPKNNIDFKSPFSLAWSCMMWPDSYTCCSDSWSLLPTFFGFVNIRYQTSLYQRISNHQSTRGHSVERILHATLKSAHVVTDKLHVCACDWTRLTVSVVPVQPQTCTVAPFYATTRTQLPEVTVWRQLRPTGVQNIRYDALY